MRTLGARRPPPIEAHGLLGLLFWDLDDMSILLFGIKMHNDNHKSF